MNSTSGHRIRKLTKGRTQCRRLSALRRDWGRVVLSAKPYPHKYAEAGARNRSFQLQTKLYYCTFLQHFSSLHRSSLFNTNDLISLGNI